MWHIKTPKVPYIRNNMNKEVVILSEQFIVFSLIFFFHKARTAQGQRLVLRENEQRASFIEKSTPRNNVHC
jgi:hypothetical protein